MWPEALAAVTLTARRDWDGGFLGGPLARCGCSNKRWSGRPSKSTGQSSRTWHEKAVLLRGWMWDDCEGDEWGRTVKGMDGG